MLADLLLSRHCSHSVDGQATGPKPDTTTQQAVVRALVPRNPRLTVIDDKPIATTDIADAYTAALGWTESQRRSYLAKLQLLAVARPCAVVAVDSDDNNSDDPTRWDTIVRSHSPDAVVPGLQYDPSQVKFTAPVPLVTPPVAHRRRTDS